MLRAIKTTVKTNNQAFIIANLRESCISLAECDGDEVVYVAARLKDVVSSAAQLHGWNQPAVNVNIANIPMPTEEERAEMRALDAKLDAFAARLKDTPYSRIDP